MAHVEFKAKIETIYNMDDTIAFTRIKVPALTRRHCDMGAFRTHPVFGPYSNSDLFLPMLEGHRKKAGIGPYIRLDRPFPENVSIDTSGFLAKVRIDF